MTDREVGQLLREIEVADVSGRTVHHRIAVDGPALPAAPCRLTARALTALDSLDLLRLLIVVEHMVATAVRTVMMLHRHIRMRHRDLAEVNTAVLFPFSFFLFTFTSRPFEQLEVHQVVGDDEKIRLLVRLPPAADESEPLVVALAQRRRRLHQERIVLVRLENAPRIAVRAVHHEADVMVVLVGRHRREDLRPRRCALLEKSVTRRLVEIPERTREMSRRPPVDRPHVQLALADPPPVRRAELALLVLHERSCRRVERFVVFRRLREDLRQLAEKLVLRRPFGRRREHGRKSVHNRSAKRYCNRPHRFSSAKRRSFRYCVRRSASS